MQDHADMRVNGRGSTSKEHSRQRDTMMCMHHCVNTILLMIDREVTVEPGSKFDPAKASEFMKEYFGPESMPRSRYSTY